MDELHEHLRRFSECYICNSPLDWSSPQEICTDHVIATIHGGRTHPENLRPVHVRCNAKKGSALYVDLA